MRTDGRTTFAMLPLSDTIGEETPEFLGAAEGLMAKPEASELRAYRLAMREARGSLGNGRLDDGSRGSAQKVLLDHDQPISDLINRK
jgi:hypothetical protein